MSSRLISFVLITVALGAAPACKKGASADPAAKPATGEPAADQPADQPVMPSTEKPAAPAAAGKTMLGPIDLSAGAIDLVALFPGTTAELHAADPDARGGDDEYAVDTIVLHRGPTKILQAQLDGSRITLINIFDPAIATPTGVKVGDSIDTLDKLVTDVGCFKDKYDLYCESANAKQLAYSFGDDAIGEDGEGGDLPIAKVARPATIETITWTAPQGSTLAVSARPAAARLGTDDGAGDDDDDSGEANRKPTADEVNRCARLLIATGACGIVTDEEYGWLKGEKKKWSAAAAHKECDVPMLFGDGGPNLPMLSLQADKVATVEAGAKQGCAQLKAALYEVDPGMAGPDFAPQ